MADEQKSPGDKGETSDSGLGNLPPLSDFDSGSGLTSDSGLPPLSSFESDTGDADSGGLPPISDIDVETPHPTGGNIRPGQGQASSGGGPLDTPSHGGLGGYQDLSADSDFSPETPEIGPGPDSDLDTPMFDSAFGGGDAGFDRSVDTPAPTQAMETPMFGGTGAPRGNDQGFDPGAFGGFDQPGVGGGMGGMGGGFNAGTPMPDFSPDTNLPMGATPPPEDRERGRGGAMGILIAALVALIIGIVAGPYVSSYVPLLPNPQAAQVSQLQTQNQQLQNEVTTLRGIADRTPESGGAVVTEERYQELLKLIDEKSAELAQSEQLLASTKTELDTARGDLSLIEDDIANRSEEYVKLQEQFDDLQNETAITEARQRGLAAEVERLTGLVGGLEEAAQRSNETKQALANAVDRLAVQVQEGLPLTPARYAHEDRVQAVQSLRSKIGESNYVTPELQKEYTDLYLKELQIASTKDYFYAKVPVTNRYGVKTYKWAEALMMGNWGVYYRTLDGKNIGTFENVSDADTPIWQFREALPPEVQTQIEAEVMANRPPDYAEKISVLAERELNAQEGTVMQRQFNSL
jgi:hypothetical protein